MTQWTVARQAPLSLELSRQGYWSGLPFPFPGDLPDPGIEPDLSLLYWQADSLHRGGAELPFSASSVLAVGLGGAVPGRAERTSKLFLSKMLH